MIDLVINRRRRSLGGVEVGRGEMGRFSPETLKGYQALSGDGAKTGHLDAKTGRRDRSS